MFEIFLQMLANDERIQFSVTRKGNGLSVLIQPELKGVEQNADDQINQLRGALAIPLYIETTAEELDANFPMGLAKYAGIRNNAHNALGEALGRVKEGVKEASKKKVVAKDSQSTAVLPETIVEEVKRASSQSNSLFGGA